MSNSHNTNYRWIIVAISFIMLLFTSGIIMTFGIFIEPITKELNWSRTEISIGISLFMFIQGAFAPFMGKLMDRCGPKKIISIGVLFLAVCIVILSMVNTLGQFIVIYGIFTALAYTTTSLLTTTVLVARWFDTKKGLALGITVSGFPLGPLVFSPLITYLILTYDWRSTFVILGIFLGVVLFPFILIFIRDSPHSSDKSKGNYPFMGAEQKQILFKNLITQSSYYKLSGAYFTCGFTMSLVSNHYHSHTTHEGFSVYVGSNTLALMGLFAFAGTILSGYLSDILERKLVLSMVYLVRSISFVFIAFAQNTTILLVAAVLFGLSWTATGPLTSALAGELWGIRNMGKVIGAVFLVHQVGASLGALLGGIVFDLTNSYFTIFILASLVLFTGSMLSYSIKKN
jgi:MFS family permease